jgi:hypothetical protein
MLGNQKGKREAWEGCPQKNPQSLGALIDRHVAGIALAELVIFVD